MNLSFRTLKGDKFKLDASPDDTVLDLKKKVVQRYEDTDYSGYRLIYKGKILNNEHTLTDAGLSEQGFIVVMRPKRPAASKTETPPAASSSAAAAPTAEQKDPPKPPAPTPAPATAPEPTTPVETQERSTASPSTSGSTLVTGAEYDSSVQRIVEMGFAEAEVKRALRAAFNNPDRAVDYLFNGIPASAEPPAPAAAAAPATPGADTPAAVPEGGGAPTETGAPPGQPFNMFEGGGAGGGGAGGGRTGNLDFLRQLPPFNNMRRVIQSNPSVVHQLLQQLEQTDPALLQLIHNNREEFFRLLNEPVEGSSGVDDAAMDQLAQAMAASGAGDDSAPGPGQIFVTEEEHQVINRLTELGSTMGLEQVHVVQAWLACDRDENLAANFLLNQADDLRAQQAEDASIADQIRRNAGGPPPDGNPPGGGN